MKYFLPVLVICILFVSTICQDQIKLNYLTDPLHVIGSARESLAADQISINLKVITLDKKSITSYFNNAVMSTNIINGWKRLGINETEIQTKQLKIQSKYKQIYNNITGQFDQVFEGEQVINSLSVITQQLELVGNIIEIAIEKGVTTFDSVVYSLSPKSKSDFLKKLLTEAIENAKNKAQIITSLLNQKIVSVKSIQILNYGVPINGGEVKESDLPVMLTQPIPAFANEEEQYVEVLVVYIIEEEGIKSKFA